MDSRLEDNWMILVSKLSSEGLPAKAILACRDIATLFRLQSILENDLLSFEYSRDVKGVELAASLKGLIAIAVGIADGLGFRTNMFGLIMTYGVHEFVTVMKFLGVYHKTAYSIAGIGDLITTCISENSRNRRFGKLLGQGYSRNDALKEVGMVVEGVSMAKTIQKLSLEDIIKMQLDLNIDDCNNQFCPYFKTLCLK